MGDSQIAAFAFSLSLLDSDGGDHDGHDHDGGDHDGHDHDGTGGTPC